MRKRLRKRLRERALYRKMEWAYVRDGLREVRAQGLLPGVKAYFQGGAILSMGPPIPLEVKGFIEKKLLHSISVARTTSSSYPIHWLTGTPPSSTAGFTLAESAHLVELLEAAQTIRPGGVPQTLGEFAVRPTGNMVVAVNEKGTDVAIRSDRRVTVGLTKALISVGTPFRFSFQNAQLLAESTRAALDTHAS